ncbi:CRISPR-associated autoregulator DevR family protein [Gloeomargarita lithophora Alchichica-D10]|uniref:CRISPR-associated autoregulator DevR family protein n=1 Tax=Gloeomargarita lithophora Alchichica-D10 TaxID=1188229 RepID=A0A1J0AEX0_9CYAN|nr:type I-B CRISPR-associated protein Cas7/Cst2/DevR [Gloeomargarita lithophora]APB34490.1 CRISPR-associated autoregulator DevR family protein [Gloeomargarita lithophora Alchichica-D10]
MSKHLFITVVTPTAIAANNRGEGDGSTLSTLQKITCGNDQHTTVSAEAIRWGLREYLQNTDQSQVNRTFDPDKDEYHLKHEKPENKDNAEYDPEKYIDDDLFGYMDAKKGADNKDATKKRRGVLEVSRAISLDPYWGDIAFGSTGGQKGKTSIHSIEVHRTAYQYSLALTPESLKKIERADIVLDAITSIRHVGGNHSRFLYEFRPESIVIRITDDPSPWIMNCFKRVGESVGCPKLVRLVEVKDIDASELIVAGEIADTPYGSQLQNLGVTVHRGVKEAIQKAKEALNPVKEEAKS